MANVEMVSLPQQTHRDSDVQGSGNGIVGVGVRGMEMIFGDADFEDGSGDVDGAVT
jgi:hypothetical protein